MTLALGALALSGFFLLCGLIEKLTADTWEEEK